jgi:heme oxygenase (biliverdin-IX-beta and delta-forming)
MAAYEPASSVHLRPRSAASEDAGLPARLRRETASLHARVEAATGLPGSIHDLPGYVDLLRRLHRFHAAVEARLADPCWAEDWAALGIELADHRRAHLLVQDLEEMQVRSQPDATTPAPEPGPPLEDIADFPAALGCLYVTEGSSLGGRVIGPAIRSVIGPVPTGFFQSDGRHHPSPWRTLTAALRRFGDGGGDASAVADGARAAFRAFELQVAAPDRATTR